MPVRFRCVYCNQLLGISRRKAGTIVRCTNCEGQIIVPEPEPVAEVAAVAGERPAAQPGPSGGELFEQSDFGDLLKPFALQPSDPASEPQSMMPPAALSAPVRRADQPVVDGPASQRSLWLWVGWVLTAVLTFVAGYLIGRGSS